MCIQPVLCVCNYKHLSKRRVYSFVIDERRLMDMFGDDLMLPKATIVKAIKERIPGDMKVGGETSDLVVSCCTTLIHLLSSTANEISEKNKRATIQPEDVVQAAKDLGFESYVPVLEKGTVPCCSCRIASLWGII